MEPIFFAGPAAFRAWLAANHATAGEVHVGYFNSHTGLQRLSWSESVDEALCFGWIDGVVHRIDGESHRRRFTPRRPGSIWSLVNVGKYEALEQAGRVHDAGRAAFAARKPEKTAVYAFEQAEEPTLSAAEAAVFRSNGAAWEYFGRRPPSYRRTATWWVVSARRQETRDRRLATLIACSEEGRHVPSLRPRP